jgi:hypothetical protein
LTLASRRPAVARRASVSAALAAVRRAVASASAVLRLDAVHAGHAAPLEQARLDGFQLFG